MKKIFLFLAITILTISCKAQYSMLSTLYTNYIQYQGYLTDGPYSKAIPNGEKLMQGLALTDAYFNASLSGRPLLMDSAMTAFNTLYGKTHTAPTIAISALSYLTIDSLSFDAVNWTHYIYPKDSMLAWIGTEGTDSATVISLIGIYSTDTTWVLTQFSNYADTANVHDSDYIKITVDTLRIDKTINFKDSIVTAMYSGIIPNIVWVSDTIENSLLSYQDSTWVLDQFTNYSDTASQKDSVFIKATIDTLLVNEQIIFKDSTITSIYSGVIPNTTWVNAQMNASELFGITNTLTPFLTTYGKNTGLNVTGIRNSLFGYGTGYSMTTGYENTGVGFNTLRYCTTCNMNTTVGSLSQYNITTGNGGNCNLGYAGQYYGTTFQWNCNVGGYGQNKLTGSYNSNIAGEGQYNATTMSHSNNVGYRGQFWDTSGSHNNGIGNFNFFLNKNGSGNIGFGDSAGYNETGSNKLYIANRSTINLIYGILPDQYLLFDADSARFTGNVYITSIQDEGTDTNWVYVTSNGLLGSDSLATAGAVLKYKPKPFDIWFNDRCGGELMWPRSLVDTIYWERSIKNGPTVAFNKLWGGLELNFMYDAELRDKMKELENKNKELEKRLNILEELVIRIAKQ